MQHFSPHLSRVCTSSRGQLFQLCTTSAFTVAHSRGLKLRNLEYSDTSFGVVSLNYVETAEALGFEEKIGTCKRHTALDHDGCG